MQHHRDYVKERKTNYDDDDDGAATSAKAKQLFILYSQFVFYSVYLVFTFFMIEKSCKPRLKVFVVVTSFSFFKKKISRERETVVDAAVVDSRFKK